jgi:GTP-binding protein
MVVADIPGLIEGAHRGAGLGLKFLRHIERTLVLVHIIDISGWERGVQAIVDNYHQVNHELGQFNSELLDKPQIVALNKIDVLADRAPLEELLAAFREMGPAVHAISAVTGEGTQELIWEIAEQLAQLRNGGTKRLSITTEDTTGTKDFS